VVSDPGEAGFGNLFPAGPRQILKPDKGSSSPLQGQAFLYLGTNPSAFVAAFSKFGIIYTSSTSFPKADIDC
jgi:hypothetical protein